MTDGGYLDVRELAHQLRVGQAELVRLLQDDGVEVTPLSPRRWRVPAAAWETWFQKRQAAGADQARQRRLRRKVVRDEVEMPPANAPRVRFRR